MNLISSSSVGTQNGVININFLVNQYFVLFPMFGMATADIIFQSFNTLGCFCSYEHAAVFHRRARRSFNHIHAILSFSRRKKLFRMELSDFYLFTVVLLQRELPNHSSP